MYRVMIFIDGAWLFLNRQKLRDTGSEEPFQLDYEKLPVVIRDALGNSISGRTGDDPDSVRPQVVRTFFFGAQPVNYHPDNEQQVENQEAFYDSLRSRYGYEVETFKVDFNGFHISPRERFEKDLERLREMNWVPHEKQVDVALATRMMAMAAMPGGFDIGALVSGDQDFLPVLRQVRALGRQTAIVTIYGAAAREFLSPQENGIGDYETVLLNNYVDNLKLVYDKRVYTCASCGRNFKSSYRPRRGENMYCNACRADYRRTHPMDLGEEDGFAGEMG
ncbi:MAG: NYN domain-containing protein [Planctomycetota bacterium]|jgi:hypothetical protein